MKNLFQQKLNFTARLKRRYSLRFHMTLILAATVCSGFLATRTMLALHLNNVMVRYPLAVIFAYLVFFMAVKLWLKYIAPAPRTGVVSDNSNDLLDAVSGISPPGTSGSGIQAGEVFNGAGGGFSGGGASGSFDGVQDAVLSGAADTGGGIGDAVGDVAGDAASALGDEGGIVVVLVFAVLAAAMAVVIGAGVYLVYQAPFILSEAAFDFVLAAGLIRGTRRINSDDWMGSVFKTTSIPFALTVALAFLAGYLMHHYLPRATRISELFSLL